ncbi:MAG TPA: YggS family pyridoxal phosphate-dependent enzyme [Bryobacteraceae bacterium]|nr:YggS family pyridoxal phosphate-dependent enzyme [Bryobacteraceae bacterium]
MRPFFSNFQFPSEFLPGQGKVYIVVDGTGFVTDSFTDRLARVRDRMCAACARAGRDPGSVRVLAVTKVFGPEAIREAYQYGLRDFGENYVQEMERKAPAIAELAGAKFHLIGHLQSNKTKKAAQLFASIDSIDSVKLAARLDAESEPLDAMIEVKLSEEENKSGADPADLPAIVDAIRAARNLKLTGLMTVPPWSEDAELSRPYFARLRELATRHSIAELSMGMSNDLEVAIEEGATWVRVGTALFGKRKRV